ncbi:PAS domain S-box protein [Sphingomonas sp. LHG3406-1]|uniref:PAS domain S-box protein n=1 Tax=Sphingomonas sp. LHG3406-1 TaxID=2804617 RepID=UPI00261AD3D0|nr:PAS domain S-box protein [Sphingomonas sp. LHG3406-1]
MDALTTPARPDLDPGLWQQLADQVPHLVWMADGNGHAFWFNRRCAEYLGVAAEDLVGSSWTDVIHPEDVERVGVAWNAAVSTGQGYEAIYRLRGADGGYRDFLARAEPARDGDGKITCWFGTSTDVSERMAAERYQSYLAGLELALRGASTGAEAKQVVVRLLGEALKADRVFFCDPCLEERSVTVGEEYRAAGIASLVGKHHFSEEVFELYTAGKPIVVADYAQHGAWDKDRERGEIADLPFSAVLDFPLVRDGRLVAVLCVHQVVPRQWTEDEVELAIATAGRCWDRVERVRAEQALSAANARFRAVLDNTQMAVFLLDDRARCIYANAAAESLTGYAFDEMKDRSLHDLVHHSRPDHTPLPMEDCPIGMAIPSRSKISGEEMFIARDGSFYPVSFSASPVLDEDGEPIGTVLEARNIANKRARQAELEASEAQFRTTAEAVPGLLFVTDPKGENSYVNQFYKDYTGIAEVGAGDWWSGVVHPDDLESVWQALRVARETRQDFRLDYRIRRHDGEYRWLSTKASPTLGADGRIERWVGVSLDIHDRRAAEEKALAAAEEIEAIYSTAPIRPDRHRSRLSLCPDQ